MHNLLPRSARNRRLVAVLGTFVLGLSVPGGLHGAPSDAVDVVDVAAYRVASAVAEGVALSLRDAPQDERALLIIGTRLDDTVIKSIQQSPTASSAFVEEVAARYPLSTETKEYIATALVGLSQICEDFPLEQERAIDPCLLKLIIAFRQGIKAGVETARHSEDA